MNMSTKIIALLLASGFIAGSASAAPFSLIERGTDVAKSQQIQHDIDQAPALSAAGVKAQVVDHIVYIRGLVDTYQQKAEAEDIVRSASRGETILNLVDVSNAAG